jgi:carboxypeptidase family protein/TonB-dependent receptor-like protein
MAKQKLIGILWISLFCGIALAQVTTGTISGTVKDSTGAVLPGAQIVLLNEDTGISRTVRADAAGRYSASSLSLGKYRVTATLEGFQTVVRTGLVLTVGQEAVVDLSLSVGAVSQTVEVAGEASMVETTNAAVSGLVNQEQMRDLPLNGRSFADLALLSPGILMNRTSGSDPSTGFGQRLSVNGSRADANLYLIDGSVVNDTAGNTASVAGLSLGVEGIREFRVFTHNFSAEYGRNSGSVVSVVTRAGTNQFHGSAYEFVRNNIFDARDFFNPGDLPPFRRNQFGGALGGPMRKDRIFFFANYEGLRQRQGTPSVSYVPDANARQGLVPDPTTHQLVAVKLDPRIKPYLDLYPLPNGQNFGDGTAQYVVDFSAPLTEDYALERMDVRLSDKDSFFWRYIFDPSNRIRPRPVPTFVQPDLSTNHFVGLGETHIFSGTALNDLRFSFNRTDLRSETSAVNPIDPSLSYVPGLPIGDIRFTASNSGVGGNASVLSELGNARNAPDSFTQNLFQISDTFSLVRGGHTWKFGADLERSQFNSVYGSNFMGVWQFGSLTDLLAANPNRLDGAIIGGTSTRERGYRRFLFGWFVQDDFRVTPRLTLNLGIRHEFFTDPTEVNGRTANLRNITDAAATVGPAFQAAKLNFAPRVGLAWDPTGNGKNSVRAGIGLYYNQVDSRTWGRLSASESKFFSAYQIRNPTTFPRVPTIIALSAQSEATVQWQLPTPTVIHYGLDLQRQLSSTINLRLGYIGSYGYNETRSVEPDIRIPQILPNGTKFYSATAPFVNPNFATIEMLRADVNDNYNAFQAALQKTLGAGLVFQASYTFSKALSVSDGSASRQVDNGGAYDTMDWLDPNRDYGRSAYDQRHTFVFNGQYQMPWDHRLKSGVEKALFGGWAVNGIFQYGSGLPLNVNLPFNNSNNGDAFAPDRPDLAPGATNNPTHGVTAGCGGIIPAGQELATPDRWFDPCAFGLPAPGTYGNVGRNTLQGPNLNMVNFTLVKNTALWENKRLEFRAEFFNILNHPSFGLPQLQVFTSARLHSGNEGVVTSTTSQGRQIQFGMKLIF